MSKVRKGFDYIKKMVKIWIKDVEFYSSNEASELMQNFHKWISTRNNALYDPLLSRMVNELMKRASYMLMNRLNKMGLTILSGNFSKIIVGTTQFTYHEAFGNISNILKKCVQ
jgi:hypothetical protein